MLSRPQDARRPARWAGARGVLRDSLRATRVALVQLTGGLGTALLALAALVLVAATVLTSLVGIGLLAVPGALGAVRAVAERERARLSRWGPEVIGPGDVPRGLRLAATDPATRRELRWLCLHATMGLLLGLVGVLLPLFAFRDVTFPLWWWLVPDGQATASLGWSVDDWTGVLAVALLGLGWIAIGLACAPALARLQARPGRRLLTAGSDVDLPLRIAQLTATRAGALDAHATELRRIERSLHDGTQNRLVAVSVLVGAARRTLARDPTNADALLERAQDAAEQALGELRAVVRGILPPVLADRGLDGAIVSLAAACPVPCHVHVDVPGRCAASVEATAYFVVAEALTNVARHGRADHATVTVRTDHDRLSIEVTDDGRGGADEVRGSGLSGIRRRIEAHDGRLAVISPAGGPTILQAELPCGS